MKKVKIWLKSPWSISIGTAVFSFLMTICYDLLKDKPVFSTLASIFIAIWNFLIAFLNFELKVWWVLLGIALIIFIIYILYIIEIKNSESNRPLFLGYTKDTISGLHWEWIWEKQCDGNWGIENLHPICPNCETPLVLSYEHGSRLVCLRCNRESDERLPDLVHVEMLLIDNVKKGHFDRSETQ